MYRRPLSLLAAMLVAPTLGFPASIHAAAPATREFRTPTFQLSLRADTQTLAGLAPIGETDFDFLPSHLEAQRRGAGYVHLGDLDLRVRNAGGEWRDYSSWLARRPVRALPAET